MTSVPSTGGPNNGFDDYMRKARRFPILTHQEEDRLARAWRDRGDEEAANTLVTSHLRLVAKIALSFRRYDLPMDDLVAEGSLGMMQAVRRFDPDRGFRLSTYAAWWIRAAIQEYILHSWSLVKIGTTAAQKRLFFNLRRMKAQVQAIDGGDLHPEQVARIAHLLDVPEQEVVNMNGRLSSADSSLNAPIAVDAEGEWQDSLVDGDDSQETKLAEYEELLGQRVLLNTALLALRERERDIFIARRLEDRPATLEDLSQRYNISRERVRQVEARSFEKLQQSMRVQIAEHRHNFYSPQCGAVQQTGAAPAR